jgi:hypothetical protein
LALFGRRLSERGDGFATPAAENLHKSSLLDHLVGQGYRCKYGRHPEVFTRQSRDRLSAERFVAQILRQRPALSRDILGAGFRLCRTVTAGPVPGRLAFERPRPPIEVAGSTPATTMVGAT